MGLLSQMLTGGLWASSATTNGGPLDDRYYQTGYGSAMTTAGIRVDSEVAQKLSAWFRGREIVATVVAMLPLHLLKRLENDGGSEVATGHPLYNVIHDAPHEGLDSFQWRRQAMYDLIDCGWAYDWIRPGRRGAVHELHRIKPWLVTPKQIISGEYEGRYIFDVRDEASGQSKTYTQDDIFYRRGAEGKGILQRARENIALALATEGYAAGVFGKGTINGGVIKVPGVLDEEASRRMAKTFVTAPGEWNLPKVLEQGADWTPGTMSPEDFQMLLSRKFSVDDMARWLGVPRQMLENSDPSFGNAEQFDQAFITYGMGPWLSLWEFAINQQLILAPKYYAEFKRDAIVRADLAVRTTANVSNVNAGLRTVNEIRRQEGWNAIPGKADELREPQNITGKPAADDPAPQQPAPKPPADDESRPRRTRAEAIAVESAARVLRKEVTAVQKMAVRHAGDGGFNAAIAAFYDGHAELVAQTLQMSAEDAAGYCASQADQIVNGDWTAALSLWQTEAYAAGLAAIALETEQAA